MNFTKKDFYWLTTTAISIVGTIVAIFVFFVSTPSQKPPKNLLSVEFHRITGAGNIPLLFKMMEGAILEYHKGFSTEEHKQYSVIDGNGNSYGAVTEKFKDIYKKWPFSDHKPVNLDFWRRVSGNSTVNDYISYLYTKSIVKNHDNLKDYAKFYMCYIEQVSLFESGGIFNTEVFERIYNDYKYQLCSLINYNPMSFYYTALTIENNTDKIITDVKLSYSTSILEHNEFSNLLTEIDGIPSFAKCRRFKDFKKVTRCEAEGFIQFFIDDKDRDVLLPPMVEQNEGIISTLEPGEKLFILINAYHPDINGLPKKYLYSNTEIKNISYNVDGYGFSEQSIKPLGDKRLGIITTPTGGIGGQ